MSVLDTYGMTGHKQAREVLQISAFFCLQKEFYCVKVIKREKNELFMFFCVIVLSN
jgi:hypothetical protein